MSDHTLTQVITGHLEMFGGQQKRKPNLTRSFKEGSKAGKTRVCPWMFVLSTAILYKMPARRGKVKVRDGQPKVLGR